MTGPSPRLSLVVPAYNEEQRIEASLKRLGEFLSSLNYETELVLVDDGSGPAGRDAYTRALDALPANVAQTSLRHDTNRGKGAAVRTGCLAASNGITSSGGAGGRRRRGDRRAHAT